VGGGGNAARCSDPVKKKEKKKSEFGGNQEKVTNLGGEKRNAWFVWGEFIPKFRMTKKGRGYRVGGRL